MQLIMEAEKDAVIRVCLLLILFHCLKSPFFFFFFPNCVTTGTRDPMDGVLRNPVECCNKKLFPIDLLPSQLALYLDCFGHGGNGARANIQQLIFSGALWFLLRNSVN